MTIYYMVDKAGNNLEASQYPSLGEKYGISNITVLKSCYGVPINRDVTFKAVTYETF